MGSLCIGLAVVLMVVGSLMMGRGLWPNPDDPEAYWQGKRSALMGAGLCILGIVLAWFLEKALGVRG
jgi:hypothetical protein